MSNLVVMGNAGIPRRVHRLLSAAGTTNATNIKDSAADLYTIIGNNARASISYLKLYDKAAAPTVGTDVPLVTIALPASLPFALDFPGLSFGLGLGYAFTTAAADADTGALTAADITALNIIYA
jgi:hypothetical protein